MTKNNTAIKIDGLRKPLPLKNISFIKGGVSLNGHGNLSAYPIMALPIKQLSDFFPLTKRVLNLLSIYRLEKYVMQLHKNGLKLNAIARLKSKT